VLPFVSFPVQCI